MGNSDCKSKHPHIHKNIYCLIKSHIKRPGFGFCRTRFVCAVVSFSAELLLGGLFYLTLYFNPLYSLSPVKQRVLQAQ